MRGARTVGARLGSALLALSVFASSGSVGLRPSCVHAQAHPLSPAQVVGAVATPVLDPHAPHHDHGGGPSDAEGSRPSPSDGHEGCTCLGPCERAGSVALDPAASAGAPACDSTERDAGHFPPRPASESSTSYLYPLANPPPFSC